VTREHSNSTFVRLCLLSSTQSYRICIIQVINQQHVDLQALSEICWYATYFDLFCVVVVPRFLFATYLTIRILLKNTIINQSINH